MASNPSTSMEGSPPHASRTAFAIPFGRPEGLPLFPGMKPSPVIPPSCVVSPLLLTSSMRSSIAVGAVVTGGQARVRSPRRERLRLSATRSRPRSLRSRARSGNGAYSAGALVTIRRKLSYKRYAGQEAPVGHRTPSRGDMPSRSRGLQLQRHFASVLAFFRRRVPGPEEAFDLAAETFAAALASLPRFEPGPAPPQVWLFAIARHKLSEARRSGRIQDEARRALSMQPIDSMTRGSRSSEDDGHRLRWRSSSRRSLPSSETRSGLTTSRSATTRKSQRRFAAQRVSFASA